MENAPPRERKKKVQPNDKSEKKRQENEKRRAQPEVRLQAVVLSLHKAQNRVAKLKIEKERLTIEMSSEYETESATSDRPRHPRRCAYAPPLDI